MEHHGVEAKGLELASFQSNDCAGRVVGPYGSRAFAQIPRAKAKTIVGGHGVSEVKTTG